MAKVPSYANLSPEEEAKRTYQPYLESARRSTQNWWADKGLLRSSMAGNAIRDLNMEVARQQSLLATDLYRQRREQDRSWQLSTMDRALNLWEMLNSRQLQKASLPEIPSWFGWPRDPKFFKYLYSFNPALGDSNANKEYWPRYADPNRGWKSTDLKLRERQTAVNESAEARLREELELTRSQIPKPGDVEKEAEDAFKMALWEIQYEPIVNPETGLPALDEGGNTIYKNPPNVILGFIQSGGRSPGDYIDLLRDDVATAWRASQYAGGWKSPHPRTQTFSPQAQSQQAMPSYAGDWRSQVYGYNTNQPWYHPSNIAKTALDWLSGFTVRD